MAKPAPETRLFGPLGVAALFCAAAFAASLLLFDRAFLAYDDGIAAEGARLVLKGKVPYRDFWALYAPGSYYVNALLLKTFGMSFLSIRLALPLMVLVQAGMLFGILRRLARSRVAAVAAAVGYIAYIPVGIIVTSPISYWLTAALSAVYCFVRWVERPRMGWALACGTLLGISALFRQDGGIWVAAALALSAFLIAPRLGIPKWRSAIAILGPFVAIGALTVTYFACRGALAAMVDDTLRFALTAYPHSRPLPYPMPWDLATVTADIHPPFLVTVILQSYTFWLLPAGLVALATVALYRMVKGGGEWPDHAKHALACAAAAMFLMISVRPSLMRIPGAVVLGLVVFAAMATDKNRAVRAGAIALLVGGVIAYASAGPVWVWGHRSYGTQKLKFRGGVYAGQGYAMMIDMTSSYIHFHTRPGEKIFSGSPAIYFTTLRDAPTRYYEPHPCLTDTPEIQRIIIRDIERGRVRYFVRARDWVRDGWFTIEREHQPRELIRHIQRNYRLVRSLGILEVYKRRTPFASRREQ